MDKHLAEALSDNLESAVLSSKPVGGGDINDSFLVELEDKTKVFVKHNPRASAGFFEAEASGLDLLRSTGAIRVPEVIGLFTSFSGDKILCLEYIPPGRESARKSEMLGTSLAEMHREKGGSFGGASDNFIGILPQSNKNHQSWGEFFIEERLKPQLTLGESSGWLMKSEKKSFESKFEKVRNMLDAPEELPSVVHGDLWTGNVYWAEEEPVLIDPAAYYGSREADIAFTEMFGRLSNSFYKAYNEAYPLAPGYEARKTIHNLYHLLTHSNMFGGSYIETARSVFRGL